MSTATQSRHLARDMNRPAAATTSRGHLGDGLVAGVRWLYATVQPDEALVQPYGAQLRLGRHLVRIVPAAAAGTPLIVVDLFASRAGPTPLNTLPAAEVGVIADELHRLGMPHASAHYRPITGTIAFDIPAHPSLRQAVERFTRGCPRHGPAGNTGCVRGRACTWRVAGLKATIWPPCDTREA